MNNLRFKFAIAIVSAFVSLSSISNSRADVWGLWDFNSTNSYSDPTRWSMTDTSNGTQAWGPVPGPANDAYVFFGELQVNDGGNFTPKSLTLGWEANHVGTFRQTGGSVATGWTRVGYAGNQVFNQSGGTYSASDLMVGWVRGDVAPGTGVVNQTGGNFETRAIAYVGLQGGTGTVNVSAGTNSSVRSIVGWQAGGNGTVNLSGGLMQVGETTFVGFIGGTGVLDISGGNYVANGNSSPGFDGFGSFRIGDWGVGTGTVNLSGTGVVNASRYTAVGGWGNGTLNVSGGTWNNTADDIILGDRPPGVTDWTGTGVVNQTGGAINARAVLLQAGTYNLNGGWLTTAAVGDTKLEANGVFNFNGGILRATVNHNDFLMADTVEIKSGGAIIHTEGNDVWINKGMTGAGGLTKWGTGMLRLKGNNSYGGYTTVVEGKLQLTGRVISTNNAYVIVESANFSNPTPPELEVMDGAVLSFAGPFGLGWSPNTSGKFTQAGGAVSVTDGYMTLADRPNTVGTADISGGTLTVAKTTVVGREGSGTLNIFGGVFNAGTDPLGSFRIGDFVGPNGVGTMTLSGTGVVNASSYTAVGGLGNGTLNISGGVFNAGTDPLGSFRIADLDGSNGVGTMTLSGTGVVNASSYTAVGGLGNGTLNVSGGTWNNTTDDIILGDRPPGVTDWTGTGVVNQSGGVVNARAVYLQAGTYNLDGGVLTTAAVGDTKLEANGVFNFDGGTLRATINHVDFLMADTVEIKSGGAIIDTAGNEVWINKGMTGAGGLTKKGSGLLKLTAANNYSGSTTVQEGTLRFETVSFTAEATPSDLAVNFVSAPADGQVAIFPGTLNGNPTVTFNGLATGQSGVFSPLSGKATFTTTAVGLSFETWSGGQALNSALLGKYAVGGATGPSAASVAPVLSSTGGGVTLSALVRTNASAGTFSVVGEYSTNLTSWFALTNNPAGTPSANTNGVPEGFQRKDFVVPAGSPKMFLRLKSSL